MQKNDQESSDQCKEIEENNRMGKTRDLFKKIRDTKGTFHAKMSSIKDRNGMDLTEAENIKKRWQEYWSGLPCPPPGDLPDPGIEPRSAMSPALAGGYFTTSTTWEALIITIDLCNFT